ncbi:hypothetical protein CHS0354_021346 [Potamilus streckersoni]|uniref:Uncharacterized protein n=1 Tax=Potamilus streckersoni TaxID=2493646 RepID=A0AAE0S405_9BIVA|nr:hypothetical protein CHS0354_021346 [Potamilus streckersoni]
MTNIQFKFVNSSNQPCNSKINLVNVRNRGDDNTIDFANCCQQRKEAIYSTDEFDTNLHDAMTNETEHDFRSCSRSYECDAANDS